jgi:hypothetical protein
MRPALLLVLVVSLVGPALGATPAENAHGLCRAMEETGATTECTVNAWGSSVDARVAMNAAEARRFCAGVVAMLVRQQASFQERWKLRLFSPYSGDHPIAVCPLK